MDALPYINIALSTTAVIAILKLTFQAGQIVQHIRDLDERVSRLEGRPRAVAHGG